MESRDKVLNGGLHNSTKETGMTKALRAVSRLATAYRPQKGVNGKCRPIKLSALAAEISHKLTDDTAAER